MFCHGSDRHDLGQRNPAVMARLALTGVGALGGARCVFVCQRHQVSPYGVEMNEARNQCYRGVSPR